MRSIFYSDTHKERDTYSTHSTVHTYITAVVVVEVTESGCCVVSPWKGVTNFCVVCWVTQRLPSPPEIGYTVLSRAQKY